MKRPDRWAFLLGLLLTAVLTGSAHAAEAPGYLVRLDRSDVTLAAEEPLPGDPEPVWTPQGIYTVAEWSDVEALAAAGVLDHVEEDSIVTLADLPDDPAWTAGQQPELSQIGMEYVWNRDLTAAPVRVGIVDSGLYAGHEDLQGCTVLPGVNFCGEEGTAERSDTSDEVGHGTFVAGIIGAVTSNALGGAGLAPNAQLVPLKCFTAKTGRMSDVVAAIYCGVDEYDCRVLNLSLGSATDSEILREAVAYAASRGVVLVAASGNLDPGQSSTGDDALQYPAAYPEVIGVGAIQLSGQVASFSRQNAGVFLTAPGQDLYGLSTAGPDAYKAGSGTSYAAPMVSAAAAVALGLDPDLTAEQVGTLLRETTEDLGEPGYDWTYGWGALRMDALVMALEGRWRDPALVPSGEGGRATVLWDGLPADTAVQVLGAVYGTDGCLTALSRKTVQSTWEGTVSLALEGLAAGAQIRLFFLDGTTGVPLSQAWTGAWENAA